MARRGRRSGLSGTRDAILDSARQAFNDRGYDGATIRDIAGRAGVDPALVHHYYGSKRQLFTAALDLPIDPTQLVRQLVEGDRTTVGHRLVQTFVLAWDAPSVRTPLLALLRSAASSPDAAAMLRQFMSREVFGALVEQLDVPNAALRSSLAGSQLIGLAVLRYVIGVEPLASLSPEAVAELVGPTVQRYLTGDVVDV